MKTKYIALVLTSAVLFFSGCSKIDDFLDEEPSKNTQQTIETADQLDAVLATYATYPVNTFEEKSDIMFASDDYEIDCIHHKYLKRGYVPRQLVFGLWADENTVETSGYTWRAEYQKIYLANLVLDNIDKVSGGTEEFKANLKADAHFLRAVCYFQLALAYCLYYDGTNGDELGITLKKTTSFEEDLTRASLKDTWEALDNEVEEALKITKPFDNKGTHINYRGSTASVRSFAARYYLYKGDYENAAKYAKMALDEYSVLKDFNDPEQMYNYSYHPKYTINKGTENERTITFNYPYIYKQLYIYWGDEGSQMDVFLGWEEFLYAKAMSSSYYFYPSQGLLNAYNTDVPEGDPHNDLRYKNFMIDEFMVSQTNQLDDGACMPGYINYMGDIISGPTTAEMYLILAECAARSNDVTSAMKYLNTLRKTRIRAAVYQDLTATDAKDALKKILMERRREKPFSIRWYDMKRLNANDPENQITVTRTFYPYNSSAVLSSEQPIEYKLEPGSRHYALPIYSEEIENSKNVIQQNTY